MSCEMRDRLDALVIGEATPREATAREAAALAAHAGACAECARELRWLKSERSALRERAAAPAGNVVTLRGKPGGLAAVRARARELQLRERRAARRSVFFAALGAAAALLVAVQAGPRASPVSDGDSMTPVIPWCAARFDARDALESDFAACLMATPRAVPGANAVCL